MNSSNPEHVMSRERERPGRPVLNVCLAHPGRRLMQMDDSLRFLIFGQPENGRWPHWNMPSTCLGRLPASLRTRTRSGSMCSWMPILRIMSGFSRTIRAAGSVPFTEDESY